MRLVFARNTDASVGYADSDVLVIASDIDSDRAGRRVFNSVFNKILDNFTQMIVIDISIKDRADLLGAILVFLVLCRPVNEVEPFFVGVRLESFDDVANERNDVNDVRVVF